MEKAVYVDLTAGIVETYVASNKISAAELPRVIADVHAALTSLGSTPEEALQDKTPVVSVRASVKPDYLVCLECGKKQKTLKRHLETAHGLTPEQYRADYGLRTDYPLVAKNYSRKRAQLAKQLGLGRKGRKAKA